MWIELGYYRHYKGQPYELVAVAKHSETLEELAVYRALYDNAESEWWGRPLSMWTEQVEVDGQMVPRFQKVDLIFRASGDVICPDCGQEYRKHPEDKFISDVSLRVLCNGDRAKL